MLCFAPLFVSGYMCDLVMVFLPLRSPVRLLLDDTHATEPPRGLLRPTLLSENLSQKPTITASWPRKTTIDLSTARSHLDSRDGLHHGGLPVRHVADGPDVDRRLAADHLGCQGGQCRRVQGLQVLDDTASNEKSHAKNAQGVGCRGGAGGGAKVTKGVRK